MKLGTGVRSIFSTLILVGLVLGLQACGGGGSAPAPLPDQDGSGIYSGTATVDSGNTDITDLRGIIYNNRFMFFSVTATPHVLYDGMITSITKDDYTATVDVYENGTKTQTAVAVTGKVLTANSITGTIGTAGQAGNHNGTFSLTFDAIYNRGATPDRIKATGFNQFTGDSYGTSNFTALDGGSFNIDANVSFPQRVSVVYITDCNALEFYAIPDSSVNIYSFENYDVVDNGGCPTLFSGSNYSGYATVIDNSVGTDKGMLMAITNGTNSIFSVLTK